MKKFIVLTILLIITRYTDLQTTYFSTPDLKTEANPLVSLIGFGWVGLIITQIVFLALLVYALWVYSFKTVRTSPVSKGVPLNKFISLFYFDEPGSLFKIIYKLPTNKNSLLFSLGYIFTYTIITWGFIVSLSTFLLLINKSYRDFYISNQLWVYLYIIGIALFIFFLIKFFRNEYAKRMEM